MNDELYIVTEFAITIICRWKNIIHSMLSHVHTPEINTADTRWQINVSYMVKYALIV